MAKKKTPTTPKIDRYLAEVKRSLIERPHSSRAALARIAVGLTWLPATNVRNKMLRADIDAVLANDEEDE